MGINYIIIGDSIIYGIGDFESGGWATMFKNHIVNKDNSKECSNYVHIAGFPGATSTDILNKMDSILGSFNHNEFINTIILSIGVNDTQQFNDCQKVSIEQYKANIEKIIKYIMNKKFNLIILGLTRIESDEKFLWKPSKYYDNEIISDYDAELKKISNNNKIKYISMKDILKKEDFIDGLHPNHNGHKKIFGKIVDSI